MKVKKEGKKDGQETELIRYDIYLHKRRDATLIKHLEQFRLDRAINAEARRLMNGGVGSVQSQRPMVQQMVIQTPLPVEDSRPSDVRHKMRKTFG